MKKALSFLSFLLLSLSASAQTSVTFSYDYSGNRTSRQLYLGNNSR